ncbi:T-lymphocyte surface antigen Ly-9-like [Chanos chanos]|uniref:T-lymphocyte surface antigen Ly-9-like n=1 Tax=Chanos chanos TaxID=29144 RepID=A0A6J2W0E8_CHACN|nr:T-lymphocyte surface antigen Ly-9-like [Chanos chanos]
MTVLLTGVSGFDITVFSTYGENVTLPCKNVIYQDCSSTTWLYNNKTSVTIEMVSHGKIRRENTDRGDRLSVGSDCSLNIHKVKVRDAGLYTCRQFLYEGADQTGVDYSVHLTVLKISSSLKQTEIRSGRTVTLYCSLHYRFTTCNYLARTERLRLSWVSETGADLQNTSTVTISHLSECNISLTVELQDQDNKREWRCQLTKGKEIQTSVSHVTRWRGRTSSTV